MKYEQLVWQQLLAMRPDEYDTAWSNFDTFYSDMGPCPNKYILYRINPGLPFAKGNCVWDVECSSSNRREYHIWQGMKQRCLNPKSKDYRKYGGRGITVEERWQRSFYAFYSDMGPCPEGFSIERKDVNGGYTADNCIWADDHTQANNKRDTIRVTHEGKQSSLKQFCTEHGLNYKLIHKRVTYQGWTLDMCLDTYVRKV